MRACPLQLGFSRRWFPVPRRYRGPDAAQLFWFGRPRVLLRIVQLIYYENSLSVAAILFSLWQDVELDWRRYGSWPFLVVMISIEILLLLFMSLNVLPVYALTTAAGSHSADSVIEYALKKGVRPDIARQDEHLERQRLGLTHVRWQPLRGIATLTSLPP
jgi:mlo protein